MPPSYHHNGAYGSGGGGAYGTQWGGSGQHSAHLTDAKLDEWVAAKRAKDYATADRIREELRMVGVDPDTVRPAANNKRARPW